MTLSSLPTKAMVLAAGLGTRMKPLTDTLPKPLIEVAGVTLIDRALDWLAAAGVQDVVVNSFYMAAMLEAHVLKRRAPHIVISREEMLLETGGGIRKALPLLDEGPFFSANSDTICIDGMRPALMRLAEMWENHTMDALLLLHPVDKAVGYEGAGDFFLTDSGCVQRRGERASAPFVFTGVQLLHPRMFAQAPEGPFSMNVLYNQSLQEDGVLTRVHGLVHDGSWLHVGDPKGLAQAEDWFSSHLV